MTPHQNKREGAIALDKVSETQTKCLSSATFKVPDPLGLFPYKITGISVFVDNRQPIKREA